MADEIDWSDLEARLDALLALPDRAREERLTMLSREAPMAARHLREWLSAMAASDGYLETARAAPARSRSAGDEVGTWRLMRPLGRGGMGEVWLAQRADGAFEKLAAIKFLHDDKPGLRERLRQERRILARLDHPGIARLLDGGIAPGGAPYLVAQYVDGVPLDAWCCERRPDLQQRLSMFRAIADAVAYAHANLIVHRDLKPANILIDRDGKPHLLDFGIAKLLDPADTAETLERALTPQFAAPEQLTGAPITTATDVHALGTLLYLLLSGRPPLPIADLPLVQLVRRVCEETPAPPSTNVGPDGVAAREFARDLDAIVLKALAKSPRDRYASVAELIADLDEALSFRPVGARRSERGYRMRRYLRRHRLGIALTAAVVAALAVGLAGTLWQAREAARERDAAQRELDRNEAFNQFLIRLFSDKQLAEHKLDANELLDRGMTLLRESGPADPRMRADVLDALASFQFARGDPAKAAQLHEELLRDHATQLSIGSRARALCLLGNEEAILNKIDSAQAHIAEGRALATALPTPQRTILVSCLTAAARVADRRKQNDEASQLAQAAVATARGLPRTLESLWVSADAEQMLAVTLFRTQHHADALALSEDAYQRLVEGGYGESGDAAVNLVDVAVNREQLGALQQADRDYARALALSERVDRDSNTFAASLVNHATLKNTLEQSAAARALLERALPILLRVAGRGSAFYGRGMVELAMADVQLGETARAVAELDEADGVLEQAKATRSLSAVYAAVARANAHLKLAEPEQAKAQINRAIAILHDTRNERVLPTVEWTAVDIALAQGRFDDAEAVARDAVAIARRHFADTHWKVATSEAVLADVLAERGHDDEARRLLEHAVPILSGQLGEDHSRTRRARADLVRAANPMHKPV